MSNEINQNRQREEVNSKSTFEISVKFMQNNTWQGEIHWIENDRKQNFRSVLEMLRLMDEALTADKESLKAVSW